MPLFQQVEEKGLRWGIWKIEEDIPTLISFLKETSFEEQLQKLKTDNRKKEWLSVRVLLAALLKQEKEIGYLPSGKPFLEDSSYQISISHTKGYAAVILHPHIKVGIDIERIGDKVARVRTKFLQPEENNNIDCRNEINHLLLHFSAKETIYKLLGLEGLELKKHLFVSPFQIKEEGSFKVTENYTESQLSFWVKYKINSDFVVTYSFL